MKIILASNSPRRRELMEKAGLSFRVIPAECEEAVASGTPPEEVVASLALQKARWVADNKTDGFDRDTLVIGADTVVAVGDEILGKPASREDAFSMLKTLSGKEHSVYTGVAVIYLDTGREESFVSCTRVFFYDLTDEEINAYIDTKEPFDKAGAYGIQGRGGLLVKSISGDYNNVVGLPVAELVRRINAVGFYRQFSADKV